MVEEFVTPGREERPIEEIAARSNLTKTQFDLWLGQRLRPDLPVYNIAQTFTVYGPVDPETFQRAFQALVDHSDALRTTIIEEDGVPMQQFRSRLEYRPEYRDFSQDADPHQAFGDWAQEHCRKKLDLAERLFEAFLVKISDHEYIWYMLQHHLIGDGFSSSVLYQRLAALYQHEKSGASNDIPPLPQYAEHLQRLKNQREETDPEIEAYWKRRFAQTVEPLTFYGRASMHRVGRTDRVTKDLGPDRTKKLLERARKGIKPSVSNIFTALTLAYLHRISGNERLRVGLPFHNRRSATDRETLGLFVGILPLCMAIEKEDTFLTLVRKVSSEAIGSAKFGYYALQNYMHSQSYEVFINHIVGDYPEFDGLPAAMFALHPGYGTDSMTFWLGKHALTKHYWIGIDFSCELFDQEQQEAAFSHLLQMLDALLDDPHQPICQVDFLSADERQRILVDFNHTARPFPQDRTIHRLLEKQVEQSPRANAVVFGQECLTYRELNSRANRLARYLRELGAAPGSYVGICVERSADMVVGLLAILKAGAAYVPLDADHPEDRLATMLNDCGAQVLLTQESLVHRLPAGGPRVVCLDALDEELGRQDSTNLSCSGNGDRLAYVAYTSGSTGAPRGVCVPHKAVNRLVLNTDYVQLGPDDVVAQVSNVAFDAATFEIWGPLLNGGRLEIVSKDALLSPRELEKAIEDRGITALFLTTALFNQVARVAPSAFKRLRYLLFGGEAVTPRWVREVLDNGAPSSLLHVYGPTETTTFATWYRVTDVEEGAATIPIGRPIANTQVYVLDDHLQPVPLGVEGELCVGGPGLAQGYLNLPELTEEKFVRHPFDTSPEARLYRTGDIVRLLADGNVEFVGRRDHQVKIRGFRVELTEIEAFLKQSPGVREAVVVLREDRPGEKQLVAYIVASNHSTNGHGDLRGYLQERLPFYMLPAAYVEISELPLTPNGKVNRNALPAPDTFVTEKGLLRITPRDNIELELLHIWEDVFDNGPIGMTDDFFNLGGHSLSAAIIMDRIQDRFGRQLSPSTFFSALTIEELATMLRTVEPDAPLPIVVPIRARGAKSPFFCVHPAPGTVFCYVDLARNLHPDQPFYGLQAPALNGKGDDYSSMEEMAVDYVRAMREVQPEGPYLIGGFSSGGVVAYEMAHVLEAQGQEAALVVIVDSLAPGMRKKPEAYYDAVVDVSDDAMWLAALAKMAELFFQVDLDISVDSLRKLSRQEQVDRLSAELKRVGYLPPDAHDESIFGLIQVCKASVRTLLKYRPKPYAGNVAFLHTTEHVNVLPKGIGGGIRRNSRTMWRRPFPGRFRAIRQVILDLVPTLWRAWSFHAISHKNLYGWPRLVKAPMDVKVIPGNHISLLLPPNVEHLAAALQECLDNAQSSQTSGATGPPETTTLSQTQTSAAG